MTDDWSLDPSLTEGDCAPVGSINIGRTGHSDKNKTVILRHPSQLARVFLQLLGIGKNRYHSELLFDVLRYGAAALQKSI